jgi:hypothetical protein
MTCTSAEFHPIVLLIRMLKFGGTAKILPDTLFAVFQHAYHVSDSEEEAGILLAVAGQGAMWGHVSHVVYVMAGVCDMLCQVLHAIEQHIFHTSERLQRKRLYYMYCVLCKGSSPTPCKHGQKIKKVPPKAGQVHTWRK